MPILIHKECFKCHETKPLSEFYKHPRMGDGHLGKCKECARRDVIENRNRRSAQYKEYDRMRNANDADRAASSKSYSRQWSKKNPEKVRAQQKTRRAILAGVLINQPCHFCGAEKTVAHHHDYSKPLDVRWLCQSCHKKLHAELARQSA